MLREELRPANEADALILEIITALDVEGVVRLRALAPAALCLTIVQIAKDDDNLPRWRSLAAALEEGGFTASAITALNACATLAGSSRELAEIITAKIRVERRARMDFAARADERLVARLTGAARTDGIIPELEADGFYAVLAHNDPAAYQAQVVALGDYALTNDPLRDPLFTKVQHHASSRDGLVWNDCSFLIMNEDSQPVIQVEADIRAGRYAGCRETGIRFTLLAGSHPRLDQAGALAVRQLALAVEWAGTNTLMLSVDEGESLPPSVNRWIAERERSRRSVPLARIDLTASEEEIEHGYRDSHRQSVRWGRKNMRVTKAEGADPAMVQAYFDLHAATGWTPALSRETLETRLATNRFNLFIGWLEEQPAVVLITSNHCHSSYYWASRKQIIGNKPLGHFVLHSAVMDAKHCGQTRFVLGELLQDEDFGSKLNSIALYKRGFATHIDPSYYVALNVNA